VTRRRLAFLRSFADDVAEARRRVISRRTGDRPTADGQRRTADGPTADELARRLDETRERLRRDIPPRSD
jgi:hypothetical protein